MTTPDRELLRELSSLRDLLEPAASPAPPSQPSPAPAPAQPLLDLAAIFDDEFAIAPDPVFPRFTLEPVDENPAAPCREALIQALVDECLPRLEAALRERLRGLDDTTLRAWAEAGAED